MGLWKDIVQVSSKPLADLVQFSGAEFEDQSELETDSAAEFVMFRNAVVHSNEPRRSFRQELTAALEQQIASLNQSYTQRSGQTAVDKIVS